MRKLFILLLSSLLILSLLACGNTAAQPAQTQPKDPFYVESVTPVSYKGVADVYIPETKLVGAPMVVQAITAQTGFPSRDRSPAVCILRIDKDLNVVEDGKALTTLETFMALHQDRVIPAFFLEDAETIQPLTDWLTQNKIIDAFVMAHWEKADLVLQMRTGYGKIQGALWFDSISDRKEALLSANRALAAVICTAQAPTLEDTAYFNTRMKSLWVTAQDTAGIYAAIASGANGIICTDTEAVFDVYASIPETTVTGKSVVIGHRGTSKYLENTLPSFRKAMEEYGCPAVELDLRLSSDGELMIMHDASLDRTTTGTGKIASTSLAQLKTLEVTENGDGDTAPIPTFEEVLQEFQDSDLVFYCHTYATKPEAVARFNELVTQYGYEDRVILFFGSSNIENYNYKNLGTDYSFISGDDITLLASEDPLVVIYNFMNVLTPLNFQPIFYDYAHDENVRFNHANPKFYYQMSARGFLNVHSVTNGQVNLEKTILRSLGSIGALTDSPELTTHFYYGIDAKDQSLAIGQAISLEQTLLCQLGTDTATCGYTQLSGPTLSGDTLAQAGTVTLVFYADLSFPGNSRYRIYSTPITITFE